MGVVEACRRLKVSTFFSFALEEYVFQDIAQGDHAFKAP
jgi:hypothetical protein